MDGQELSKARLSEDTLSQLEAGLLGLENRYTPDIIVNSAYQDGGQVLFNIRLALSSKLSLMI